MAILTRSARLFSEYLGKTRGGNSLHFVLQLPTPMSAYEFLVPAGRPILSSTAGWMGKSTLTMADW